ncbi:class I SAM-dependent DNA methyltransferase [Antarctobacter heliothermus]|uniref:Methyltransferase domain-containing protein n=1 Tax=Antarctobacter heliothermus TaxID=74033 RepID=A0A239B468_9RHOB|nr:class I SAM-dependent methyltransferase [Antarctobacter heliothermus]SNS02725.1 Methyltransferase domain-containing protein [Antarctobacter heliothermus]
MSNRDVYQRQAETYAAERNISLFERPWLDRVLADVPSGGAVLDLGCGAGAPIGVFLSDAGYDVTGVDYAPAMLALYARRLPQARVIEADMRALALDRQFDAIIGWGSFFHLTQDAQRAALPTIAEYLAPGGRLLLTVGPGAGEVWGTVAGERVYHASLSPDEYAEILSAAGAPVEAFVPEDPEARGHTLLLARRAV